MSLMSEGWKFILWWIAIYVCGIVTGIGIALKVQSGG